MNNFHTLHSIPYYFVSYCSASRGSSCGLGLVVISCLVLKLHKSCTCIIICNFPHFVHGMNLIISVSILNANRVFDKDTCKELQTRSAGVFLFLLSLRCGDTATQQKSFMLWGRLWSEMMCVLPLRSFSLVCLVCTRLQKHAVKQQHYCDSVKKHYILLCVHVVPERSSQPKWWATDGD